MQLTPSDPDIQTIVGRIQKGDIDLQPDFQRGEVWSLQKKRRLMDSIIRNWHVPPIHIVVVKRTERQEVLDGQQRLAAIRDFFEDHFSIDGTMEPYDTEIKELNGLKYSKLPTWARRRVDNFTIRVFRISEYKPDEPGELFYRLNQITNLTAAEQRNAFFGPVRDQVKELVTQFNDLGNNSENIGFSNARMAYDDVMAKLLMTLENETLSLKITAGKLSDRYRSQDAIPSEAYEKAEYCIELFSGCRRLFESEVRFNKATLLTWLVFLCRVGCHDVVQIGGAENLSKFIQNFEKVRERPNISALNLLNMPKENVSYRSNMVDLLGIFNDRSSARVADVSSVIYRDFIIALCFWKYFGECVGPLSDPSRFEILRIVDSCLYEEDSEESVEDILAQHIGFERWGLL